MYCVYWSIATAESQFIAIRLEQEQQVDDCKGSFSHWIGEDRIAHLIVHAWRDRGQDEASEDLLFGLVFSTERCIAFSIMVVVIADALGKFSWRFGRKCLSESETYEQADLSDDELDVCGDGDSSAAGATSLGTSLEAPVP